MISSSSFFFALQTAKWQTIISQNNIENMQQNRQWQIESKRDVKKRVNRYKKEKKNKNLLENYNPHTHCYSYNVQTKIHSGDSQIVLTKLNVSQMNTKSIVKYRSSNNKLNNTSHNNRKKTANNTQQQRMHAILLFSKVFFHKQQTVQGKCHQTLENATKNKNLVIILRTVNQ